MVLVPSPGATEVLMETRPDTSSGVKTAKKAPRISKKKKRNTQLDNYSRYIHRVLKLGLPTKTLSTKAMSIMNSFMIDMFERLASEAARLRKKRGGTTLTGRDVQTATRLVLSGELAYHAVSEGTKAVAKYFGTK